MSLWTELKRRNVIRVAVAYIVLSWLLLQVGDILFEALELPDWSIKMLVALLMLAFVPVVVFAWAYELTPEGVKRERDVDRSHSITHETGRKLDIAVIVLIILAIGLFLADRFVSGGSDDRHMPIARSTPEQMEPAEPAEPEPAEETRPSVAVLPFANMSADPDQEYFSDGLSDTLIHVLAEVDGLKVIARTSSFAFKGQQMDIREIADKLGVETVLEGSVQKSGNRLRIIAQLIDASDGSHLWSATFDRSADDVFAIQDEIATEVVKALTGALLQEESSQIAERYEPPLEAYQAFLLGRQEMAKRNSQALESAEAHFKRALELDPDYALAMVNLGDVYRLQAEYGGLSQPEAIELAEPLYRKALELSPGLGEAYTSMGSLYVDQGNAEKAIDFYEKGIELNPGYSTAYHWYALLLGDMGRVEQALQMLFRAAELDPLSNVIQVNLIAFLSGVGRDDEAMRLAHQAILSNPNYATYYRLRALPEMKKGDLGRAVYWLREAARRDPGNVRALTFLCAVSFNLPDLTAARECLEKARQQSPDSDLVVSLLMGGAILQGRPEKAIEYGQRYAETTDIAGARIVSDVLTLAYAIEGAYRRAMDLILANSPELHPDNDGGVVTPHNWNDAIMLAFLWQRLDRPGRREHLIHQVWPIIEGRPRLGPGDIGIADVMAHAVSGHYEEAVTALEEAIEDRWVFPWRWNLLHHPVLEPLRSREDFQELVAQLEQRLAKQQEWLEAQPPLHEVIEAGELDSI